MTIGRPLGAKLFIEGIEVPFIGASITSTVGQASISYIDLVPLQVINTIKARSMVHLFARDVNDEKGEYPLVLAFQGEVFGFNFGKSPSNRTFSISCIDNSSYWDNVLTYFFNPLQSLGKGTDQLVREAQDRTAISKGADGKVVVSHSTSSYYKQIMQKAFNKAKAAGREPDLFEGLVAIYHEIGDVNDFYRLAEQRLKIVDRICSASAGEVNTLLKQQESLDWLMGIADRNSGYTSLRMVVNDLMSIIFHDFTAVSFPGLVSNGGVKKSLTSSKTPTTIGEFLFKPNMYMIAPPMCNVFFPDEYSSFSYARNFFTEPTRMIYKPELPAFSGVGISGVALPHVYQPEAFNHFMIGKGPMPTENIGSADVQVDSDPGKFNDKDIVDGKPRQSSNGKKREQFFLSNEEKYKGIILAQESMMPASSAFRQNVNEIARRDYSRNIAKYLFYKKKFENRQVQITSHLKTSVVPGFTTLILDDSEANQTLIAYCSSVTHRIYSTQGGYTNTTLSYARTVDEQDMASGKAGEPLIPPWFKKEIFGEKKKPPASKNKKLAKKVADGGEQVVVPDALSGYFAKLLGDQGSQSLNAYTKEPTMVGAVGKLLEEYRLNRSKGNDAVSAMIDKLTRRRYITVLEAFKYIDATPVGGFDPKSAFNEFYSARAFGDSGSADAAQLKARRAVIKSYRDLLRDNRGFRG